jgi:hypothetical protein
MTLEMALDFEILRAFSNRKHFADAKPLHCSVLAT